MSCVGVKAIKRDKRGAQSKRNRINDDITGTEVRLIGSDGEQVGIVDLADALKKAQSESLDLVEIAVDSEPPVCRIMDYGKHIFDEKKSRAEAKKKQKKTQVKEIKFRPGTEEGDYQVKLRNLTRFLSDGDKAKVTMRFRGREMAHQNIGMDLLKRVEVDLEEFGTVEMYPKMEGRQMTMVIAPRKKK